MFLPDTSFLAANLARYKPVPSPLAITAGANGLGSPNTSTIVIEAVPRLAKPLPGCNSAGVSLMLFMILRMPLSGNNGASTWVNL